MKTLDILCATDLTTVSNTALNYALGLAEHASTQVSLLHVLGRGERDAQAREVVTGRMNEQVAEANGQDRTRILLIEGDLAEVIAKESVQDHSYMVVGTHGPHGLRQTLFGADILKMVRRSAVPTLVVQERSPVDNSMGRIVMPVAGHSNIGRMLDAVCMLAKLYASEVHVYQLMRPNEQPSDELLENKLAMLQRLEREGIRHLEVNEPSTVFSIGFAEPTIRYAEKIGAGCIAIMSHASDEYRYMADAEKERLLTNASNIPVLCC
ncbi:MAG: universal stress protein [Flavobacteriales bacterium]|nr:universal stress protein [Flavobacteriales bacterium]